ncbi:MAG: MBL fold metallo-hydrolase [Deltaproteobacteria bacterium]|nr:MBL fold metallo-hydrolase [Deltaproteobacteria bacterium]
MKLIILGSGTGNPLNDRASPALVVFAASEIILFDMGPGTLRQLSRIGISHNRIKHIFITHFHPDHTADLVHFLFATKDPSTIGSRVPFLITGPDGIAPFVRDLQKAYGEWLDLPPGLMRIEELDTSKEETREYDYFRVRTVHTAHTLQSLAYRVEGTKGKTFVYSGDTSYCDDIISLGKDCDLLILECSFPDDQAVQGHLTPSEAGRVAQSAGAKKLLLLNFYPEILETDIARSCRNTYKGELILGRDLMHLMLDP